MEFCQLQFKADVLQAFVETFSNINVLMGQSEC